MQKKVSVIIPYYKNIKYIFKSVQSVLRQKYKNIEMAMDNIRPRIFWKDKPIFYKQIKIWNLKKLEEAKKIMVETEILIKTKLNNYNNTLIKNLLVKLCNKATSSF